MKKQKNLSQSNISESQMFKLLVEQSKQLERFTVLVDQLNAKLSQANEIIHKQAQTIEKLLKEKEELAHSKDEQLQALQEQLRILTGEIFGKSSEKRKHNKVTPKNQKDDSDSDSQSGSGSAGSSSASNDSEPDHSQEQNPRTYSRKKTSTSSAKQKSKKERKPRVPILELIKAGFFEVVQKVHDLSEEEKICPVCHSPMRLIATRHLNYSYEFIPARIVLVENVANSYSCEHCKHEANKIDVDNQTLNLKPHSAKAPLSLLPGSWATPSLLAYVMTAKFQYQNPISRIVDMNRDFGGGIISKPTLCNWVNRVSEQYFEPMVRYLKTYLLRQHVICADETTLQVINESLQRRKSKSFIWQYRSAQDHPQPVALYEYTYTRSGKNAANFLQGFNGTLMVDGFSGYKVVNDVTLANCWVHARRYLIQTLIGSTIPHVQTVAEKLLKLIDQIFDIEDDIRDQDLGPKERMGIRNQRTKPLVNQIFEEVKKIELGSVTNGLLKKALTYLHNHEGSLNVFLNDPEVPADNNGAERGFVNLARGRHNWMFAFSECGARAIATMNSMVQTALANQLNVNQYLKYCMEKLIPYQEEEEFPETILAELLPWQKDVQKACKAIDISQAVLALEDA